MDVFPVNWDSVPEVMNKEQREKCRFEPTFKKPVPQGFLSEKA